MIYRIKANHKKGVVKIVVKNDTDLIIRGYDPENKNRVFFDRPVRTRTETTYSFGIPIASKFIDTEVKQLIPEKNKGYEVVSIAYDKLRLKPFFTDELTQKFINFSKQFSYNFADYETGKYTDPDNLFTVNILPYIKGTPARINVVTDVIEVCRTALRNDTVAGINWLLFHEYSHNFLNFDPDCEREADYYANKMYLASGYPGIESFDMVASFSHNNLNEKRLIQTEQMLDDYEHNLYYNN